MASEGFRQDQLLRNLQLTAGRVPSSDAFRAQRGQLPSAYPSNDRLEEPKQTNWTDFAHILIRIPGQTLIQNKLTNYKIAQFSSSRPRRSGTLRRMDPGIGSTSHLSISKPSIASGVAAIIDLSSDQ
ncbi:hypothetical protein PTTG_28789 [Puccinia triticina 1-1 BBBD Race 1]|uniref:Uncharacterized protein n=1 Tax=Puccinia triticina (isolate 1-1 / race 1 (BBBD)) TaxID=630390 RepID=A0A180G9K8_PUCT1|nr:hypothetical protein PTTG_28789 [Puccinia triticina 1-1 BBBD Race 1]